ncbi:MAG: hypothetical protein HRT57_01795 [Crocinitomicaceae bacterium]|nr:hypothetical protein [Crocinitomicaceae bacterium]
MKKLATLSIAIIAVALLSVSCNKGCPKDSGDISTGAVISTNPSDASKLVVIYPTSGYLTSSMGGNYNINATHNYANYFEVSFDSGQSRGTVNWSQYSILANPVNLECDAWVERNVEFDDINDVVRYTITIHECPEGCDETRTLENYVLVPAIPANYYVDYIVVHA